MNDVVQAFPRKRCWPTWPPPTLLALPPAWRLTRITGMASVSLLRGPG